jgi:hypothetical protein
MNIVKYLNMVPSQNREKPKFISWLSVPLTILDDTETMMKEIDTDFDLDIAIGDQLDKIGHIVGVSRILNFQPISASPIVDDATYRRMILAKIAKNQWDGTYYGLTTIWDTFFPDIQLIVTDNQNMTVDVLVFGIGANLERELIQNGYYVPKAQSVKYNYLFAETKIFSYDLDNAFYAGYDVGSWI